MFLDTHFRLKIQEKGQRSTRVLHIPALTRRSAINKTKRLYGAGVTILECKTDDKFVLRKD